MAEYFKEFAKAAFVMILY